MPEANEHEQNITHTYMSMAADTATPCNMHIRTYTHTLTLPQVRGKAMSIAGATNWLFTYIIGLIFPVLVKDWYPGV